MVPETNFPVNQKPVWLGHWIDIEMSGVQILQWLELSPHLHVVNGRRLRVTIYFSSFLKVVKLVWRVSSWICPVLDSTGWMPLFLSNTKCFFTLPLNLKWTTKANVTHLLISSRRQKQWPNPKWKINLNTNYNCSIISPKLVIYFYPFSSCGNLVTKVIMECSEY